jgi:tetratricopeptide (TPR) repeat protein
VRKVVLLVLSALLVFTACGIRQVETSKAAYLKAQEAENTGHDADAILYWKKVRDVATREIESNHYLDTNHFLRASAYSQLQEWDLAFQDLKQVNAGQLSEPEAWIYPDYCVLLGDYYSHQNMTDVAENFYQAVLKKSTWKSSPVYLLALERHINNSIQAIEMEAVRQKDAEKFRAGEYADLQKDVEKFLEDSPSDSVPHFLLGDLLLKQGKSDRALEHILVALDFGLPTADLKNSAEFELADLLAHHSPSAEMKSTLLNKAAVWWTKEESSSIFRAGQNTVRSLKEQNAQLPDSMNDEMDSNVRYLGISDHGTLRILVWEKR